MVTNKRTTNEQPSEPTGSSRKNVKSKSICTRVNFHKHKFNCKSQLCSLSRSGLALGSPGCSFVVCRLSPCPKYLINPYNAIFLKSQGSKDIKNDILDCQIHKYTNTNSQIHKYSLWWSARNTQHVLYFWKAKGPRTSNMIFWTVKYTNTNVQIHKYKFRKTQMQHMTKIPNLCYIFEQLDVKKW